MEKIVLYCKSFHRDIDRVVNLWESIQKYNKDNISFYVSVPKSDVDLFKSKNLPNIIEDELIYFTSETNWYTQQIVKSLFWKFGIAENYVCIDSDSYFIRDFYITDFMYNDKTPYTVLHEQRELFTWTAVKKSELGFNPKESFINDRKKVMDIFNRSGKYYDFGPSPTIWSSKVWKSLEDNYLQPNNLTLSEAIKYCASEFSWYGESLLRFKAIDIYPAEPLFKVFHYPQQFIEYKQQNITEKMIAENYLGIVMQSNFNGPLKY
jgi:hypothetical protein